MPRSFQFFICVLYLAILCSSEEPCETTNVLNNWHRSVAYSPDSGDVLCDSTIQEGWYRINSAAGETMPTTCVIENRCGTVHPIYVSNDDVPTGEDVYPPHGTEVNRTAYANIGFDCHARSYDIRIKNCSLFFVYYLVKTGGCNVAYCFGAEKPCPVGQSSSNGFTPGCTDIKPDITLNPVLSVGTHETRKTEYIPVLLKNEIRITVTSKFSCNAIEATADFNYDITYYINDVVIPDAIYTNVSYNDISGSVLLQEHWDHTFKPNMLVKCAMQARYIDQGGPSEKNFSDIYFAGIKAVDVENGIFVNEGEEKPISIQVTMPIGCTYLQGFDATGCDIPIHNGVPNYQTDSIVCMDQNYNVNDLEFGEQRCRLVIDHDTWNKTHYVNVTGKSDGIANKADRIVLLRLYTPTESASLLPVLMIWNKITLPDIKVYIQDRDLVLMGHSCYSHNDPHMRIFDGKRWELQRSVNSGEYIMYKHERLPQQVNAYFRSCYSWDALCNCGVAVRSANSIFIANFCETGHNNDIKTNQYIISRFCDDRNLVVEEITWNRLKITLPSNTTVSFSHGIRSWNGQSQHVIHNIEIIPSSLDYYLTSGLCGNYSGINGNDDFVSPTGIYIGPGVAFGKTWKVPTSDESFFNPDGTLPLLMYKVFQYCTCSTPANLHISQNSKANLSCELSDEMRVCRLKEIPKTVVAAKCISTTLIRKRRSIIDENDIPDMFPMTFDNADVSPEPVEWRNGLTEEIARQQCVESFNNRPAFGVCKDYVKSVKTEDYIDECIEDMKIAGSDFYLTTTIETFESNCLSDAAQIEILKEANTTDASGNSKAIFEVIAESVCLNNCSDRGDCKEGNCICAEGHFGRDCSLNEKTPPTILPKAFSGKCDRSSRPCASVYIPGFDFIPSNSMCKYRVFQVMKNGTSVIDDASTTAPGDYINSFQMKCNLPEVRRKRSVSQRKIVTGLNISVSNDGETFSEELTILIYDATCFECNTSSLSCFEKDFCAPKPEDDDEERNSTVIGISVCLAFLVIIIAMSLILYTKKTCMARKPHVNDSSTSLPNSSRPQTSASVLEDTAIVMTVD